MREIKGVHQSSSDLTKRWFSDLDSDLFLWSNSNEEIKAFQFSLRKRNIETAIKWGETDGVTLYKVDDGAQPGKHPGTPLLLEDNEIDIELLSEAIDIKLAQQHPDLHQFITSKIISD